MGSRGSYLSTGGFKTTEWHVVGNVDGVKVLSPKDAKLKVHLPIFSNTPGTSYLIINENGQFHQLRVYNADRTPKFDIDFAKHDRNEPYLHKHDFIGLKRVKKPVEIKTGDPLYEKYKHLFKGVI